MPKYVPIDVTPNFKSSLSDLLDLQWSKEAISANFLIPDDENHVIRVHFEKALIVRILDEMPLSTESDVTPNEGLKAEHFAYMVENALFWSSQSDALKAVFPKARHYRFITGWTCLDVIANFEPDFAVVACPRPPRSVGPT
jgi:hypothetical protein